MTANLYLDSNCAQRGDRIADHMGRRRVARDLDVLRQAVGDPKLPTAGSPTARSSAKAYANMFPDNVRVIVIVIVIDGDLASIPWTTRPGQRLHGSVLGQAAQRRGRTGKHSTSSSK